MRTQKIGFVNGTFDILHPGHIYLLRYAWSLCDKLHVAIDSDERVQELKGSDRPFFDWMDRMLMLNSLSCVDEVSVFVSDEHLEELLGWLQPDIMVVGSDWKGKKVIGSEHARELRFFDRIDKYSTTKIIQSLTGR